MGSGVWWEGSPGHSLGKPLWSSSDSQSSGDLSGTPFPTPLGWRYRKVKNRRGKSKEEECGAMDKYMQKLKGRLMREFSWFQGLRFLVGHGEGLGES